MTTKAYVRALASTGRLHYGEIAELELDEVILGKIDSGLLEVLPDQDLDDDDSSSTSDAFDPGEHNVDDVLDHLDDADAAERKRVLAAERKGKARKGVLDHGS